MADAAPGWYPDPDGGPEKFYWDGTNWTDLPPPPTSARSPLPPGERTIVTGPNHVLHAVVTLLTCGLWLPVWLIISLDNRQRITRLDENGRVISDPVSWKAVGLRILLFIVVVTAFIVIMVNAGGK